MRGFCFELAASSLQLSFTIHFVRFLSFILLFCPALLGGQTAEPPQQNPPIHVNVLNVCRPGAEEQQQLKAALDRLPKKPVFAPDFEIARGESTLEGAAKSKYVRFRREFHPDSPFLTVQYSLSADPKDTQETLVFKGRDVKDLLQLSIEDKLSTEASKPAQVIESDTPATRVSVQRFGKTTLTLARCEGADQSAYDPIFTKASSVLADYRHLLKLRSALATDIAWMAASPKTASGRPHPASGSGTRKTKSH